MITMEVRATPPLPIKYVANLNLQVLGPVLKYVSSGCRCSDFK